MSDAASLQYCQDYLRRKYAGDLSALRTLADEVFGSATDEVAVTTTSFIGGSAGGVVKFNKIILGQAIEGLIKELDPAYIAPAGQTAGSVLRFSP